MIIQSNVELRGTRISFIEVLMWNRHSIWMITAAISQVPLWYRALKNECCEHLNGYQPIRSLLTVVLVDLFFIRLPSSPHHETGSFGAREEALSGFVSITLFAGGSRPQGVTTQYGSRPHRVATPYGSRPNIGQNPTG